MAADLALSAAMPVARWIEYQTGVPYIEDIIDPPFRLDAEGMLRVPTGPGLGVRSTGTPSRDTRGDGHANPGGRVPAGPRGGSSVPVDRRMRRRSRRPSSPRPAARRSSAASSTSAASSPTAASSRTPSGAPSSWSTSPRASPTVSRCWTRLASTGRAPASSRRSRPQDLRRHPPPGGAGTRVDPGAPRHLPPPLPAGVRPPVESPAHAAF